LDQIDDLSKRGPQFDQANKLTLAYWAIRGLAQAPRTLLAYCDIPFEDKQYQQTPPEKPLPETLTKGWPYKSMEEYEDSKKSWFDVKGTVLGDYHSPNLPYLLDGDVTLSESNAILRYIGAKAAAKGILIMGTTPSEVAANEFMIDKAMEFRNKVCTHGYCTFAPSFGMGELGGTPKEFWDNASANYKDGKPIQFPGQVTEAKTLADSNAYYERFLSPGPYFAGAHVTVCDFHMYELLVQQV
jgi:glutathione S-transferase